MQVNEVRWYGERRRIGHRARHEGSSEDKKQATNVKDGGMDEERKGTQRW